MKAVVIGATGAVGKDLVQLLLEDSDFEQVDVFVRKPVEATDAKLKTHIVNFDKPEEWTSEVKGDAAFSCMGTSLKQAGSKEAQWKVDHDYQLTFAKAAKQNGVRRFVLVSSMGAAADSWAFYMKMKGILDDEVMRLGFAQTNIVRPSSLIREHSKRWTESMSVRILKLLNAIGIMKEYRPIKTSTVAQVMILLAKDSSSDACRIVTGNEIRDMWQEADKAKHRDK